MCYRKKNNGRATRVGTFEVCVPMHVLLRMFFYAGSGQSMDHSPIRRNFEKNMGILKKYRQEYYHILKEHPKLRKIAKFGCEMFYNIENIALRIWQILYTFVLRVENNTQLIPLGIHFSRIIQNYKKFANFARLYFL